MKDCKVFRWVLGMACQDPETGATWRLVGENGCEGDDEWHCTDTFGGCKTPQRESLARAKAAGPLDGDAATAGGLWSLVEELAGEKVLSRYAMGAQIADEDGITDLFETYEATECARAMACLRWFDKQMGG